MTDKKTHPKKYRFAVLGTDIAYSLSPKLHGFFMEKTGITGTYDILDLATESMNRWFEEQGWQDYDGFNVTIPHKTRLLSHITKITPVARLLGAINTVYKDDTGMLCGDNTDVAGFQESLPPKFLNDLMGKTVLIVGSGGAARAVAYGLMQQHVGQILLKVRSTSFYQPTFAALENIRTELSSNTRLSVLNNWDSPALRPDRLALVINTTPVGTLNFPVEEDLSIPGALISKLSPKCLVYDLVYNPVETSLMKLAQNHNLNNKNGLDMLVRQGAKAFGRWVKDDAIVTEDIIQEANNYLASLLESSPQTLADSIAG